MSLDTVTLKLRNQVGHWRIDMFSGLFRTFFREKYEAVESIPGPVPGLPLGTAGALMKGNPWDMCAHYGEEYGGCTCVWLLNKPALVLNDPELIGEVLETRRDEFYKKMPGAALEPVITEKALFLANKEKWKTLREHHPFSQDFFPEWLHQQPSVMFEAVREKVRGWTNRVTTRGKIVPLFQRLAFDVFSQVTLGEELGDSAYAEWSRLGRKGSHRMTSPLSVIPPLSPEFYFNRHHWYEHFHPIIEATRESNDVERTDLLSTVVRHGFNVQGGNGPGEIDFANFYFGGCFSATSVIVIALFMLSQHPEILQSLQSEVDDAAGEKFTYDALERLSLLDAVVRESMRIHSPVPLYFRNTRPDQKVKLAGCELPEDTMIFLTNRYLHMCKDHWGDPEVFRPDRWLNGGVERDPIGSGYFFPFGRGPRMCVATEFAMVYIKTALASALHSIRIKMNPNQPYKETLFFGVMLPMTLEAAFSKRL